MEGTISIAIWLYYYFYYCGGSVANTMLYNHYPKEITFHRGKKTTYVVVTSRAAIKHQAVDNFLLASSVSEGSPYFTDCDWEQ